MKRFVSILMLCALFVLSFAGCTPTISNIDDLMRPPKLSGENSGIQEAFERATANKTIKMKTPTTGSYRSSYVLFDIDGDTQEEVITFYSDVADETAVYMHVLDYSDGRWQSVADIKGKGSEVYKIDFCDMNNDGVSEIAVCWSLFESRGSKVITIYAPSFEAEAQTVRELVSEPFTQTVILDVDADGSDEVFIAAILTENNMPKTIGKVLAMDADLGIYSMGVIELTPAVSILSLQSQSAGENCPALVFLDSIVNENTAVTDIVYWDENNYCLQAPLSEDNRSGQPKTARAVTLNSTDIDKDGQMEIPTTSALEGSLTVAGEEKQPLELTTWHSFDGKNLIVDKSCLMFYSSSFMFLFTEEQAAEMVVVNDTAERKCSFYLRGDDGERGGLLFEIATVPSAEWERRSMDDFRVLTTDHSLTYAYQITQLGTTENIDEEYILSNFSTLS